jgi:hypothetical protein
MMTMMMMMIIIIIIIIMGDRGGTVVKVLWKVAGSIPDGVIGIFY